jgi:hypothetical protein
VIGSFEKEGAVNAKETVVESVTVAAPTVGTLGAPFVAPALLPMIGILLLKEVNYSVNLKSVFSRSRSVRRGRDRNEGVVGSNSR